MLGHQYRADGSTDCAFATNHKFYRVMQSSGGASVLTNPGYETGTASNEDSNGRRLDAIQLCLPHVNKYRRWTGFGISAHSGTFSMKTFGPFSNGVLDASGAYQATSAIPARHGDSRAGL